jgi:ATP-dependent DNA helicase DinG
VSDGTIKSFGDAEERLAAALPTYESRPQQSALAVAIEESMASGQHLIGQAGCGCGKSFAYLINAVIAATQGKRTIVSTATKALQDQIANGDLPFLHANLGVDFSFEILKGRSNYLCLNKAQIAEGVTDIARILKAAEAEGFNGEREGLGFVVSDADWIKVAADTDDCQSLGCKDAGGCFAQIARERAKLADIVVVNHALYFTDLMVKLATDGGASLLDEHDIVVFDEAHEIEEYASGVLGSQFKQAGLRFMVSEIRNWAHRVQGEQADAAFEAARSMLDAADVLWSKLEVGRIRQATLADAEEEWVALALGLQATHAAISAVDLEMVEGTEVAKLKKQKQRLQRRVLSASAKFADLIVADFADLVRWVEEESDKRGEKHLVIKSAPINVGRFLNEWLFAPEEAKGPTAILVSATILVDGSADYIASRLGVTGHRVIDVGTPFDYGKQSRLYIPINLPDPTPANKTAWTSLAIQQIADLVKASNGRALLLFTSTAMMRDAFAMLEARLPYTCLMQGRGKTNKELAAEFAADTHSVLFATRSFFTGVDFQGEACSLVVMDKLPFPVPTEPVTEARCEAIDARGGSSFGEYTIPVMSLVLQQGFGRLIRHRNDTGVVAILDPRLLSKGYGKKILRSLPDAPIVKTIGEVESSFAEFAG